MESYSQYYQDRIINLALKGKKNGVFLDIGAHDGVTFSNTLYFERNKNWTGLCIEPIPDIFEQLKANRNCALENCCILNSDRVVTFRSVSPPLDMLSGILEFFDQEHIARIDDMVSKLTKEKGFQDIPVPGKNINGLLRKHNLHTIDYCSIDTEGAELSIVKSIDFEKFNILSLTIENNKNRTELKPFLESLGYACYSMGLDDLYIKGEYNRFVKIFTWLIKLKLALPGMPRRLYDKYICRNKGLVP